MKQIQHIFFLLIAVLILSACDREPPIPEVGSVKIEFSPRVEGKAFGGGEIYTNPEGRDYRIDFFRMYVSEIFLIKADGTEEELSEINLFDIAEGGPAKRVKHGFTAYKVYQDVPPGSYKGIKFGIGVPDRLNDNPADYGIDHPLSIGNQMYWSWRAGYRFISIEGKVDSSQAMDGAQLAQSFGYHIGKDSVNSPNVVYQTLVFDGPDDAFTVVENEEAHIEFDLDINQIFNSDADKIDLVEEGISHSVPGEQFELSLRVTKNLVDHALTKKPF